MDLNDLSITNRFRLLKLLGGKCRMCPINNIKSLEIDHIFNDGADERTEYGSSEKIYGWYLEHQNQAFRRLQPLCKEHHEEKHHPRLGHDFLNKKQQNTLRIELLMDCLQALEGDNKTPVDEGLLVTYLAHTGQFTEEDAISYIRRMLREASIYESMPGCYNRV